MKPELKQKIDDLLLFSDPETYHILQQTCQEHNVPLPALQALLAWERVQQERKTAHGRTEFFDGILDDEIYWGESL